MKALHLSMLFCATLSASSICATAAEYVPGSGWQMIAVDKGGLNQEGRFDFTVRYQAQLTLEDLDGGTESYGIYDYLHWPFGNWPQYNTTSPSGGSWSLAPGNYSIRIYNGSWWVYSSNPLRARFRVDIPPEPILPTTTPREQVGCIGREASFRATAKAAEPNGSPSPDFDYQWLFNGTNILAGETNSRLSLVNLTTANEGFYSCVISNQFGSVTSPPSFLRVLDACAGLYLYAGLSITGAVGRTYFVDYVTNATDTNWITYASNTFTSPVWLFIDTNTPAEPRKFFRVRLQP